MSTSILPAIQNQLILYGYPICLILGTIGNIFIIIIFSRQRQNACTIYLISSAIMNDLYLTFNSFAQIFPFYYADESKRAFAACKIRYYLSNVLGQLAKTMIVLACIDRFMITNNHATYRALSTSRLAKLLIFISIIFWPLFASHIVIMTTIINQQCGTYGTYSIIYTSYIIIFVGLLPPIILGVFGYLTYRSMKQIQVRIQPVYNQKNKVNIGIRRRDRELLVIVISEVFAYVITTTFYPLIISEQLIARYVLSNKTIQYTQIENLIFTVSFLLLFVNNAIPFYIYLISSKPFRHDFKELIIKWYRKLTNQPQLITVRRKTQTLTNQNTVI